MKTLMVVICMILCSCATPAYNGVDMTYQECFAMYEDEPLDRDESGESWTD